MILDESGGKTRRNKKLRVRKEDNMEKLKEQSTMKSESEVKSVFYSYKMWLHLFIKRIILKLRKIIFIMVVSLL